MMAFAMAWGNSLGLLPNVNPESLSESAKSESGKSFISSSAEASRPGGPNAGMANGRASSMGSSLAASRGDFGAASPASPLVAKSWRRREVLASLFSALVCSRDAGVKFGSIGDDKVCAQFNAACSSSTVPDIGIVTKTITKLKLGMPMFWIIRCEKKNSAGKLCCFFPPIVDDRDLASYLFSSKKSAPATLCKVATWIRLHELS